MRNIAICGKKVQELKSSPSFVSTIEMDGIPVHCGLIHTQDIKFDNQLPENCYKVLVRKIAFSCNYRDKHIIFKAATKAPEDRFFTIGSDFVGEVVDVGSNVTKFKVGDRVIGNNNYPHSGAEGVAAGIPTNKSSAEFQVFHEVKLIKVPSEMPDEVAAAFSVGGQTIYSIMRKLGVTEGANVLVTSAKSNTSLFAINAFKKHKVNLYATTTSMHFEEELKLMGVKELILVDPNSETLVADEVAQHIQQNIGYFDFVIDPFLDLHIGKLIHCLADGAKYTSCGFYDQYSELIGKEFQYSGISGSAIFQIMILNNIQFVGNCLGNSDDLANAIDDYVAGDFDVAIDSVFRGNQVAEFFDRTYNAKDRFGKVVYKYE